MSELVKIVCWIEYKGKWLRGYQVGETDSIIPKYLVQVPHLHNKLIQVSLPQISFALEKTDAK